MLRQRMARRVEAIVILVLLAVALGHLVRLLTGVELSIGGKVVPLWVSGAGCIGPATLAGLFWWSHR